jgi:hypothetical protein
LPHTSARDLMPAQQRGITTVAGLREAFARGEAARLGMISQREAAFGMQATAAPSGLGAKSVEELRASMQGLEPVFDEAGQYVDVWGEKVVTVIDGVAQELSSLAVTGIFEGWDQAGQQFLRTLIEMGIQFAILGSMHGMAGAMGAPTSAGAGMRGMGGLGGAIAQMALPLALGAATGGAGGAAAAGGTMGAGHMLGRAQHGAVLSQGTAALIEGSRDEAVLPLARTASGDLGVKAGGGGGPVVINADMSGATVTPGSIAAMRQVVFDLMPMISGQVAGDFNNNQGLRKRARMR